MNNTIDESEYSGLKFLRICVDGNIPRNILGQPVDLSQMRETLARRHAINTTITVAIWKITQKLLASLDNLSACEKKEPWVIVATAYFQEQTGALLDKFPELNLTDIAEDWVVETLEELSHKSKLNEIKNLRYELACKDNIIDILNYKIKILTPTTLSKR